MPEGTFGMFWGFWILVLVLLQAVTIPLDAAFEKNLMGEEVEWTILGFFITDIMINFVKPIEDNDGNLVLDFKHIGTNYLESVWFYMDFVSCIPFDSLGQAEASNAAALKTLKLFRLTRISKLFKRIAKNAKSAGASLQVNTRPPRASEQPRCDS